MMAKYEEVEKSKLGVRKFTVAVHLGPPSSSSSPRTAIHLTIKERSDAPTGSMNNATSGKLVLVIVLASIVLSSTHSLSFAQPRH